jgi:hypothetical protein
MAQLAAARSLSVSENGGVRNFRNSLYLWVVIDLFAHAISNALIRSTYTTNFDKPHVYQVSNETYVYKDFSHSCLRSLLNF